MNQSRMAAASALLLAACATTNRLDAPFGQRDVSVLERLTLAPMPTAAPTSSAADAAVLQFPMAVAEPAIEDGREPPLVQGDRPRWRDGAPLMQGFFGAVLYEGERSGGSRPQASLEYEDMQVPTIGGGAQWKLAGDNIDVGMEGLLAFSWRSAGTAFIAGGGGAAVAVDVDLFVFDLYGGPFASVFLGDRMRAYVSAGPLMQWAEYEESSAINSGSSSGFGLGYYARTGIEFVLGRGAMVGMGVRWSDSQIDLGSQGDLDVHGVQIMLTWSQLY